MKSNKCILLVKCSLGRVQAIKPETETVKQTKPEVMPPCDTRVLSASELRALASVLLHRLVFCVNRVIRHREKPSVQNHENFYSNKDKNKC